MGRLKNPFERFLSRQPFLVLDGSLATQLEKLGADLKDPLWSAKILYEAPHLVRQVHDNYLLAGADIICTATYQASFVGFAQKGITPERAGELFTLSVDLAQQARADFWSGNQPHSGREFPLIAASLGPYGAHLADGSEYRGDYDLDLASLISWHRPQVAALALEAAVDLMLFETIPSLLEAKAIVQLMAAFPEQAVMISFSVQDGERIANGEKFVEVVKWLSEADQVMAIGINCTAPKFIGSLLDAAGTISTKPLLVYPNSGEYWNATQHCWHGENDLGAFSSQVQEWYEKGARIIGGCCRTGPNHIREIRSGLEQLIKPLQSP